MKKAPYTLLWEYVDAEGRKQYAQHGYFTLQGAEQELNRMLTVWPSSVVDGVVIEEGVRA